MRPRRPIPLALYVHLPWCLRRCPYCDFNSHALRGALPEDAYLEALLRDLDHEADRWGGEAIGSVFFGGGTPSLFSPAALSRLLEQLDRRFDLAGPVEITLEANPGAADAERFRGYRKAGINRLSIGVQSFRDEKLSAIGRVHDAATARSAVAAARDSGFTNINVDLMYGLPNDDLAGAIGDLAQAIALEVPHLSWYELTLEPGTHFHRYPPPLPAESLMAEIEGEGRRLLHAHGYRRYEISAYALGDSQCRHNLNYWRFGDYIGIGAGAHGKISRPDGSVLRTQKIRQPQRYIREAGSEGALEATVIDDGARIAAEFLLNALRRTDGFTQGEFEAATGLPFAFIEGAVAAETVRGLLIRSSGGVRASTLGLNFLDELLSSMEIALESTEALGEPPCLAAMT